MNLFRFLYVFCSRLILVALGLLVSFFLLDKILGLNIEKFSSPTRIAFVLICLFVTGLWAYYLMRTEIPLWYRNINFAIKKNIIFSRAVLIFVYIAILNKLNASIAQGKSGWFYISAKAYLTLSIVLFLGALLAVVFKRTAYRKARRF